MPTMKMTGSKTLSVADLLALAGVEMKKPTVDRTGTDDGNAVTLLAAADGSMLVFSKADLLAYKPATFEDDGTTRRVLTKAVRIVDGLPASPAHEDGRVLDHVDAAIVVDRSGTTADNAVTLRWAL